VKKHSLLPNSGILQHFVKSNILGLIMLGITCSILGAIPSIDSILLQKLTDLIESYIDNKDEYNLQNLIIKWGAIYSGWWMIVNVIWRIYDYLYLKTMPLIKGKILNEIYNYVQYHQHIFFQQNLAGQITSRITEASRSFEMVVSIFGEKILLKTSMTIMALFTMYTVHHIFAIIFLSWVCIFVGISVFSAKKVNKYSMNYAKEKASIAGSLVDTISNISSVRMFTSHKFEREYLEVQVDNIVASEQSLQKFMFKIRSILGVTCCIMIFVIIYYLAHLRGGNFITIGDCVLILSLCVSVADHMWDLTQEIGDMFEELGFFNQSVKLISPYMMIDIPNAKPLKLKNGLIEFKNVTFNYSNNNLFKNKTVTINSKEKVGLVGFSGSGKTSFVNLITRLYDIEDGEISIDSQNIRYVTQDSLRSNISVIPQESILFHRTIKENILYGNKEASFEEVIEAAKFAHIHDFIMELSNGYDSLCGERGNNLSGGQRQRIIIARAILKNSPILILDEATSSLDTQTEEMIQESLNYLMKNKTVIVIAHRLTTLLNMDRLFVFDKGAIVESGTHEKLINDGKIYKKLWKSQVNGLIL